MDGFVVLQRLGRYQDAAKAKIRSYDFTLIDESITEKSDTTQRIYPHLLQAVAMVRLALSGWVEAPATALPLQHGVYTRSSVS